MNKRVILDSFKLFTFKRVSIADNFFSHIIYEKIFCYKHSYGILVKHSDLSFVHIRYEKAKVREPFHCKIITSNYR